MGKRNAQGLGEVGPGAGDWGDAWVRRVLCAWPDHTGVQSGGGVGLRALEQNHPGPWGPGAELAAGL